MTRLELPDRDVVGIRANNPSPFTLSGTNTWIVGRDPAWLVDPGPALDDHLDAVIEELESRGGLGGIALTHDHIDHAEAVSALRERVSGAGGAVAAARGGDRVRLRGGDRVRLRGGDRVRLRGGDRVRLRDGDRFGPLEALATPGHAPDHLAFLVDGIALTGDAVLGEGSVFIAPDPGALAGYLAGLERLRARRPSVIGPGHGPIVGDPDAKLAEYIAHRLERERRLVAALRGGHRTVAELLDEAWSDAPQMLRPAAAVTLAAHLEKLADEGRLPEGVERPAGWPPGWGSVQV